MPRAALAQKRDFVAKALCPRILVLATPAIADACAVNNCTTFADLLAPFGQDVSTQITVQDGQGTPYFLDRLDVKFTTDFAVERQQPTVAEIDALVRQSIAGDAEQAPMPLKSGGGIDAGALAADDVGEWAPWYLRFRQHWVSEMQPSEHEAFMHPVACLLVASGSEDDPVGALRALQGHPAVRRVQQQSFSGASVLLYHMLVHDGRDTGVLQGIDHKFDQVRRALGQSSALLRINSSTELAEAGGGGSDGSKISGIWSNSWSTTRPLSARPDGAFGAMLTMRDVAALRDAVKQMMVRSIVPHMQYQIRLLSDQTAHERRGITGRLFSAGRRYFGASAKAGGGAVAGVGGDVYFRYDSPEALMRKLADYSFMLKDYQFAQSVYQVARRDFQSEKAWKCYAGAQEMVGVCRLMWETHAAASAAAARPDFDGNFDEAVAVYLHKTHTPCLFLAVRCIIVYYELLRNSRLYSLAPRALLQTPTSTGSLYALMAEQAAYAHLRRAERPELRRFSFYMMTAGRAYKASGMSELAHRCLRMVRIALGPASPTVSAGDSGGDGGGGDKEDHSLPSRSGWSSIDSYINHELGQQCVAARGYGDALQYFTALLGSGQIPAKLQATYLQELLQLYLEGNDSVNGNGSDSEHPVRQPGPPVTLPIPTIDPRMARVIVSPELEGEDGMCLWRPGAEAPSRQADDALGAAAGLCCSVGEDVAVLLMVTNPLTVGITLNNFTLDCDFAAADDEALVGDMQQTAFDVSTAASVVLEGGQTTMVSVTITPRCAGRLEICSARYLLCDILPACTPLVLPGRRQNDTQEQRTCPTYTPDTRLGFRVDRGIPRLEVALEGFPDTLMSGSMHRASIRIANRGPLPCRSIALWLSHPSFFDIRSPVRVSNDEAGAEDTADCSGDSSDTHTIYAHSDSGLAVEEAWVANDLRDCSTFILVGQTAAAAAPAADAGAGNVVRPCFPKPTESLGPGDALVVPVWVRGDRVGAHTLGLLVGASTADAMPALSGSTGCAMRSRRFDVDLVVTPSLRVNAFVRPSLRNPHERILGIEVENMQPDLDVRLLQATFTSGHYEVAPLHADGATPGSDPPERGTRLGPRQTASLMYRARPHSAAGTGAGPGPELFTIAALRQYIFSKEKPTERPGPMPLVYSSAVLGEHGIDAIRSPLQGYIARSQAQRRWAALRSEFPLIPEKHHPALFTLYETFGMDFVLFWCEAGGGGAGRSGHHSITGIDLGVPRDYIVEALNPPTEGVARAWLKDTVQEREALVQSIAASAAADHRHERPLDVTMSVEKTAPSTSAGANAALYEADIAIAIYNHSWRYAYELTLDLISPADMTRLIPAGVRLDYSGTRSAWSWCGTTRHALEVAPLGSVV
ncbi:hypothetical protein LPJ61_004399, partial [Coemansia biformis]